MRTLALATLFLAFVPFARAQIKLPYFNVDSKGLWVEGYDPVAYLIDGKGRIIHQHIGDIRAEHVAPLLEKLKEAE